MNPTISVIVSIYNCSSSMDRTLRCLREQSYKNLEIILIDNASTDDTFTKACLTAEQDARIKVYYTEQRGVSLARNLGLEKATGHYIGFMDADDYATPDMYEYLLKLITKYSSDISSCNIFYLQSPLCKLYHNKEKDKIVFGFQAIQECLQNQAVFVSVWNKLYKREVVEKVRFPSVGMSEDLQFLYDIFQNQHSMICGFAPKYYYDKTTGTTEFAQRDLDSLKVFDYILNKERTMGTKKQINFFKTQYLKHLYALFIKAALYPLRVSPENIIQIARKEFLNLIFSKYISFKFKLFSFVCLINRNLAKKSMI